MIMSEPTNPVTGQPFESLHPEYAPSKTSERGDYTVTNRQGEVIHLTSAELAHHFNWAMTHPRGGDHE